MAKKEKEQEAQAEQPAMQPKARASALVPDVLKNRKPGSDPKRRYWVGTLDKCVVKDVHLAGVCFPRFTGRIEVSEEGAIDYSAARRGGLVALTEQNVKAIRSAVATKVVRGNSIFSTATPNYEPTEADKPLAEYVYLIAEDEAATVMNSAQWRESEPPSLLELEAGTPA